MEHHSIPVNAMLQALAARAADVFCVLAVRMTAVGGFALGIAPFASSSVCRNGFLTGDFSRITR